METPASALNKCANRDALKPKEWANCPTHGLLDPLLPSSSARTLDSNRRLTAAPAPQQSTLGNSSATGIAVTHLKKLEVLEVMTEPPARTELTMGETVRQLKSASRFGYLYCWALTPEAWVGLPS